MQTREEVYKCTYCKSPIKPPPPPPLFRGGKLISHPSLLSPPPSSPSILHKQLTWTDQLWFIQVGNSYCFGLQLHDLQPCAFPPLCSSSLRRIVTIFLLLQKADHPRETLLPLMRFTKLNKPPSQISPPGGLTEDLGYTQQ